MAQDLEKLAVEIERPIGCISRTVFWILFVIFGAILGAIGWFLYTGIISTHALPGDPHQKDAVIVALSVIVLSLAIAAIIRDSMRRAIYQRVLRRRSKN
jgi:H+/Cl- antiporter ClcA